MLAGAPLWAQTSGLSHEQHGPVNWLPDFQWPSPLCRYPTPKPKSKTARTAQALGKITIVNEVEPNDYFAVAQTLVLEPGPMSLVNIDVKGVISQGDDVDLYRFRATKGDVIGLAAISNSALDPVLAIQQTNEVSLIENDNHNGIALYYPPESPLPGGVGLYDSALSWIAPADGDYLIRVSSYNSASRGEYTLQIRARRPSFESQGFNETQIIFLDFDGATLNVLQTFGEGRSAALMSPMREFLPRWGLTPEDEAAVVEAIVNTVQDRFDALRTASLNGNLATDKIAGHFDVQILNSRDHADPWGQPNVSRVIIGGTIDQTGIMTIGLAQSIDPGNFAREETAFVLLDVLSSPVLTYTDRNGNQVLNPDTLNNCMATGSYTKIDVVGQAVGIIVAHEIGHYLGNWHTDSTNEFRSIIDEGGYVPIWIMAGFGPDRTLGTSDDEPVDFVTDEFSIYEQVAVGEERTEVNTAFALSTGRVQRDTAPEVPSWPYPLPSVRATPTGGTPPLQVDFAAGGIDYDTKGLSFTWDFADGSPVAAGPVVSHTFETPGEFLVKVTAQNSGGVLGQTTVLITVSATSPTAKIAATPLRGSAPLTVTFDGSESEAAAGEIITYSWDFGDGSAATGPTVQHTYTSAGYYAAKLTVTDSYGGTSTSSVMVVVNVSTYESDSAQYVPTSQQAAPQCGLGSGVMMISSLAGLLLISIRRRY